MKSIIAIDPGASGGIAWSKQDGGGVETAPMPEGMTEICDFIRGLAASLVDPVCYIEKVGGYMPGNSGPAACKFARHMGHLEMALYANGVPTVQVTPNKWMKAIGSWPKDKTERKRAIKEEMARRFPHLKVTLKTADALGVFVYAKEQT